jgi:transposase
MAHVRDSARTYGKSDPIDALAVARAALREPDLPAAHLDGPARDVRLLVDHRDDLVAERTRVINRLRWHLHELDPDLQIPARALHRPKHLRRVELFLTGAFEPSKSVVVRLARELVCRCADLTEQIARVERDIEQQIEPLAPALLAITGCGHLTAAKILGETAGVERFRSKDAYARYTGTAPLPVWSGNKERHRLSRVGNRQLNAALHRIAVTQARYHPGARELLGRRRTAGDSTAESLRVLKRRLSDVVYQALRADLAAIHQHRRDEAAAA